MGLQTHRNRKVGLGEIQLKQKQSGLQFRGRDRIDVKRIALDYWYRNRDRLSMTLRDFFLHCRMSSDGRTITFSR